MSSTDPKAGRAFFEGVIRDHLDVGRPDQVVLIFDRKLLPRTPGRFRTRVITRGVDPQLSCMYKSCRLKQYWSTNPSNRRGGACISCRGGSQLADAGA